MKPIRNVFSSLFVLGGIAGLLSLLHAQETTTSLDTQSVIPVDGTVLSLTPADIESFSSLSEAQLAALVGVLNATPTLPMSILPYGGQAGTFWSLQNPEWAPLPADLRGSTVWQLSNGSYLLNDLNVNYQAPLHSRTTSLATSSMSAMDSSDPLDPGDGSGTNTDYTPAGFTYTPPDYGTNLWIAQVSVAGGYMNAVASNTVADVSYEIQTNSDLTTTNWVTTGLFFPGSEVTNWTPFSLAQGNETNLFFRLRSWASSDGSGLPDWWELEYGVTDPYGDPMGDGWSNLQKFQNGWNPNVFYTPPAPQGLTANYNGSTYIATISWLPSPGPVTNYLVTRTDDYYGVTTYNFPPTTNSFTDNVFDLQPEIIQYLSGTSESIHAVYEVTAQYAGGDSAPARADLVSGQLPSISLIAGSQGSVYLAAAALPPGTTALRLIRENNAAESFNGDYSLTTNYDIPVISSTNGLYPIPATWLATPVDAYGDYPNYTWWVQPVNADGSGTSLAISEGQTIGNQSITAALGQPYLDGRLQLKQNLIFQLREALVDRPAYFDLYGVATYSFPTSYAYAGLYHMEDSILAVRSLDALLPFEENYLYRNFAFTNSFGFINTGVDDWNYYQTNDYFILANPPAFLFTNSTTGWTNQPGLLDAGNASWLTAIPMDSNYGTPTQLLYEGGLGWTGGGTTLAMASNVRNLFGLPFLATEVTYVSSSGLDTLNAGDSITYSAMTGLYVYSKAAQPEFQTVEYDFWQAKDWNQYNYRPEDVLPGQTNFSTASTNQWLLMSSGSQIQIAGYAKLAVTNGYPGVYGYLGQYFDQAFQIDTNGTVTTNTTGVLSPYGSFFATEPGPAALVTMPDIDTGERGTCTVYAVSLVLDNNHDGTMDTSFSGADATSQSSPMEFWANNNFDRGHIVDGSDFEQDDLSQAQVANLNVPAEQKVQDCQYVTNGYPAIPCTRDLEDYFRLWLPGIASAMKAMPTNYTVQLTLTGDAQIRIFQAVEADGGTNYLFDETTASNQVADSASLYVGLLTSSSPIVFSRWTNFNEHFIFCGAQTGSAQVDLQVLDGNQNVVVDAPAYMEIKDIKNMYERWTVGDNVKVAPMTAPVLAANDMPAPAQPRFQYAQPPDTNTPYILFVHGWNMEAWEKDRYAEAAYKRLYWQGYKGRFGIFQWPTGNGFSGIISALTDARNYDNSESNAWSSATGLTNLLTQLNAEYPGNVYLIAHSMGNVVVGEALQQANSQLVNTYVAMQGAVPAHCYDASTASRSAYSTPDRYANYYTDSSPSYFSSSAGAGAYINFYNTNDYALGWWNVDQGQKPDNGLGGIGVNYPGYFYSSSDGFYKIAGITHYLDFPFNTYEIFAYADPSWSYALGAQANVGGSFQLLGVPQQVNLPSVWPADTHPNSTDNPYSEHVWHSAQFRSDNMSRAVFWHTILTRMNISP